MNNSEYWEDRIANETWKTYNSIEEKNIALLEMYNNTNSNIKKELYSLAETEKTDGLTLTQQYRLNKLQGQQGYIIKEIEKLGEQIEKHTKENILSGGKDVYENVMSSLKVGDFSYPNKKVMEQMMRSPWKGSFFSERLWKDMAKLEKTLNSVIADGITTGKTVTEMAIQLSNTMNKSFNAAHLLVKNETIHYLNESAKLGYKNAGITQVQWWAAEDERTCEQCGSLHGQIFDIGKDPDSPHPGCRCTKLPVVDKDNMKKLDIPSFANKNQNRDSNYQLEQQAIKKLNIKNVNFKGLDQRCVKPVLECIDNAYKNYPEIRNSISKISQTKVNMVAGVQFDGSYEKFELALNTKYFSDYDFVKEKIDRLVEKGIYAKETTIETVMNHEIGHIFEGLYINATVPENMKNLAWDNCTAAESVLRLASYECYNNADSYKQVLSNISNYAKQSYSEGVAECIHIELSGFGNEFTKTVLKILRRV